MALNILFSSNQDINIILYNIWQNEQNCHKIFFNIIW